MNILHINSYYSGSNFYKNLYDRQIENGLDINVYVPVSKSTDVSALNLGEYTTKSANHGKYDRIFFHIKHVKIYADIVKKYDMNTIYITHAHSLFSNGYIALLLKKKYDIPYIVAVRNTDVNIFFKYMFHLRAIGIEILKEADKVIFLSESYRNIVLDKYISSNLKKDIMHKTVIIPNGIDDFWLQNKGKPKMKNEHKELRLVYAGVINKNKNLLTTVKAIEVLLRKGFNVEFTIVGRIADKGIYKRISRIPYVKYIDPKPKEELLNIYRTNDIFIMPSIKETFGLVYAEAMSQGLPIVYTKGQGFDKQFQEGEVGYHVDCGNPNEIANVIEKILDNYKQISIQCINSANVFSWEKVVTDYNEIYNLLGN
ncbi:MULTISPECIES: glycosyltransferase family 4 protein [unclassified Paenibacillus]|uniref:glycosyltransferase family 4 protein n=1 Tax=unclassified Paenibacillus TaxID=185978 RepID=UPI002476F811|nr:MULTISPECIES: glycosyltransferase family 4 protein [unclassified Paenibacillus]MDH6431130.1 glycosyltransferase involved in cell wall biosynthesis [Paenibacillus sp. PastH-4]MDH6447215.1 glycosyltransferase involved in cell wall biosynthesis [Paenibacillus sp. PastF-4]MDH6531343.1 glycosyltransferase involved in cell wall biosynthesis [Paenibacillus sp. PastH-3]